MKAHNYKELKIWQKSKTLVKDIYSVTSKFPKEEFYGVTNQARRAAVSVVTNIAEGAGRGTEKDFTHFLNMARGSLFELETLLILSRDLGFLNEVLLDSLIQDISEIIRMTISFQEKLSKPIFTP